MKIFYSRPASFNPIERIIKAFTLIELLVVITIIAILAAILFPVFSRVRENGRRTSCMSNMKQMGLATHMYCADYDDVLPAVYVGAFYSRNKNNYPWQEAILPYMGIGSGVEGSPIGFYNCPSQGKINGNSYDFQFQGVASSTWDNEIWLTGSYMANLGYASAASGFKGLVGPWSSASYLDYGNNPAYIFAVRMSALEAPSTTISILETTTLGAGNTYPTCIWRLNPFDTMTVSSNALLPSIPTIEPSTNPSWATLNAGRITARHLDTTNVLYADGHDKAQKLESLLEKSPSKYYGSPVSGTYALYKSFTNADD